MRRLRAWTVVAILGACSSHAVPSSGAVEKDMDKTGAQPMDHNTPPPPAPPRTVLEQVQRWAPQGSTVSDAGFAVPGVELFKIADHAPLPRDAYPTYQIVAVAGGLGSPILQGDDAMRAAIKGTQDPGKLAAIALAVNRRPAMLLERANDDDQRKHKFTAPVLAGGAVEFWVMTGSPGLTLMRGRLDLATGKLELAEPPRDDSEVIAGAIAGLQGAGYTIALDTLKQRCTNPAVSKALFDALEHGQKDDLRARAAMAVEACGAAAVEPLIHALENDPVVSVRATAAGTLAKLKDKRARPALEKAAQSSDSYLAYAAKEALKKLP